MLMDFNSLVEEIKSRRRALGWSQKRLANRAGVSQSLVAKLEKKINVPNYKSVQKIYKTLRAEESQAGRMAKDMVNPEIVSVVPEDTREKAAKLMRENDFSQLPVKEGDRYVGIVLSSDIGLIEDDVEVREIMRRVIPIVPGDSSREAVAELLKTSNAALVRDGESGDILGIITPVRDYHTCGLALGQERKRYCIYIVLSRISLPVFFI